MISSLIIFIWKSFYIINCISHCEPFTMYTYISEKIDSFVSSFPISFCAGWCGFFEDDWVVIAQQVYQAYVRASTPIARKWEISRQIERDHCYWFHFRSFLREKNDVRNQDLSQITHQSKEKKLTIFSSRIIMYGIKQEIMSST